VHVGNVKKTAAERSGGLGGLVIRCCMYIGRFHRRGSNGEGIEECGEEIEHDYVAPLMRGMVRVKA
jgi:hypothetical protein